MTDQLDTDTPAESTGTVPSCCSPGREAFQLTPLPARTDEK